MQIYFFWVKEELHCLRKESIRHLQPKNKEIGDTKVTYKNRDLIHIQNG